VVNIAAMDKRVEKRAEYETWAAGLAKALSGGVTTPAYVGFIGEEAEDGVRRAYPPATLKPRAGEASVRPRQSLSPEPERRARHERRLSAACVPRRALIREHAWPRSALRAMIPEV
jgi:hypothetical protein